MKPIGVFDSGLGGLTVLRELIESFPNEDFIYLGDTARLPYGTKSPSTIRKYSEQNIRFLAGQNVKAIIVACNSASTQISEDEWQGLPIYRVIEPGAAQALKKTQTLRVGVLGTRATVNSQAYVKALKSKNPAVEVFQQPCPLFVPLAEEGWDQDPITNLIAFRYLQPLLQAQIDTLILGCTHYPLLKNSIARVTGSAIELVDSGRAIAEILQQEFVSGRIERTNHGGRAGDGGAVAGGDKTRLRVFTTDSSDHFKTLVDRILDGYNLDIQFEVCQTI
jgi:glutamate racemase